MITVIKMNDKVEQMAETIKAQQDKIEDLNNRLIRLETVPEFSRASKGVSQGSIYLPPEK